VIGITCLYWVPINRKALNPSPPLLLAIMIRTHRPPSLYSQDDPLTNAIRPPASETEDERHFRLQQEAEARRISEIIDEELRREKRKYDKNRQDITVSVFV